MDIIAKLNNEFLKQDFTQTNKSLYAKELEIYKSVARNYADIENCISVLSDMHANISYIYHGGFTKTLKIEISPEQEGIINSIWEEQLLKQIHPDDLHDKHLQELRFFHFMKHLPKKQRSNYYLINKLRIKNNEGNYLPSLHRLFYHSSPFDNSIWLALCLYSPLIFDIPNKNIVVNSITGEKIELEKKNDAQILSKREKQVLRLIDQGLMSKNIAERLSISINTVNRHRQNILNKLQVNNSIEACRIAKDLKNI